LQRLSFLESFSKDIFSQKKIKIDQFPMKKRYRKETMFIHKMDERSSFYQEEGKYKFFIQKIFYE
jgi:hypothetical protein